MDALCRPVTKIPDGGDTIFVDDFEIAVSGAAGAAAIVAAKHGLSVQAVGGVGEDLMGDWVLQRLGHFGIDIKHMQRCSGYSTSCSIVTTRPDGARPALHKHGATGGFFVEDSQIDSILDTKILHVGGVGLMDRMDHGRTEEVMVEAKARGCVTTLDVLRQNLTTFLLLHHFCHTPITLCLLKRKQWPFPGYPTWKKLPSFFWTKVLAQ